MASEFCPVKHASKSQSGRTLCTNEPSGHSLYSLSQPVDSCDGPGHCAKEQSGATLPTNEPSGQTLASIVHATLSCSLVTVSQEARIRIITTKRCQNPLFIC